LQLNPVEDDSLNRVDFINGVKAIIGGYILMLFLGAVYISGNIAPYLLTYFHYKGQTDLSETDTFYILPLIFLFGTFFLPLGGRLSRRLKPRVFVLCVAPIGLIGMFISAYMTNYWAWFGLFCPSFGFVNGLLYIVPV